MAKLIWTDESLAWLREIGDYLAKNSQVAAVRVLEGIIEKAELLCRHPRSGGQLLDIYDREVREILYGHYRIIYEFAEADDAVYVLAVIHSSMDIDRLQL
jgi:plasmid stabilization system protein ParE